MNNKELKLSKKTRSIIEENGFARFEEFKTIINPKSIKNLNKFCESKKWIYFHTTPSIFVETETGNLFLEWETIDYKCISLEFKSKKVAIFLEGDEQIETLEASFKLESLSYLIHILDVLNPTEKEVLDA